MAIEMTIVTPPFVLDFAGAYLDSPPEFSDQTWADWEAEKRDQFSSLWDDVSAILSELKRLGIYILDPSPSNIRFHQQTAVNEAAHGYEIMPHDEYIPEVVNEMKGAFPQ